MFAKRSSIINLIYSGQQFSYTEVYEFHCPFKYDNIKVNDNLFPFEIMKAVHWNNYMTENSVNNMTKHWASFESKRFIKKFESILKRYYSFPTKFLSNF